MQNSKKAVLSGDIEVIDNMLICDAVYIPIVRTISEDCPGFVLTQEYLPNLEAWRYVYDMKKFVSDFFDFASADGIVYKNNEDFIMQHDLQAQVGWYIKGELCHL